LTLLFKQLPKYALIGSRRINSILQTLLISPDLKFKPTENTMSKENATLELHNAVVEIAAEEITTLDNLSLALIGGGEAAVGL